MTRLRAEPLVSNEERDWRLMQEGVGRTAQEPLTHAGVAIGSHYDEIGFEAAILQEAARPVQLFGCMRRVPFTLHDP